MMDNKVDAKKTVRILGNIVTVIAIVFIAVRLYRMRVDLSVLGTGKTIAVLALAFVFQLLLVILSSIPWITIVNALSGKRIRIRESLPVFTKANLYKYIPGNVFQYVGRNRLAVEKEISHVDVATATVIDTLFQLCLYLVLSLMMLGDKIVTVAGRYVHNVIVGLIVIAVVASAAVIIVILVVGRRAREYAMRYRDTLSSGGLRMISRSFAITAGNCILSAVEYFICIMIVFGDEVGTGKLIMLTGAYLFAWIIGFVTPGAPGGIGVREAVMLLVCTSVNEDLVMIFVLLMRLGSVAADIAAGIIGEIVQKTCLKAKPA